MGSSCARWAVCVCAVERRWGRNLLPSDLEVGIWGGLRNQLSSASEVSITVAPVSGILTVYNGLFPAGTGTLFAKESWEERICSFNHSSWVSNDPIHALSMTSTDNSSRTGRDVTRTWGYKRPKGAWLVHTTIPCGELRVPSAPLNINHRGLE